MVFYVSTANALANFGHFCIYPLLSLYFLNALHFQFHVVALILGFCSVAFRVTRILFAPCIDKIPVKYAIPSAFLLCSIGYFGVWLSDSPIIIMLFLLLAGTGYGANAIIIKAIASSQELTDIPLFLRYSIVSLMTNLTAALAPFLGTLVLNHAPGALPSVAGTIFLLGGMISKFFLSGIPDISFQTNWWRGIWLHIRSRKLRNLILLTVFAWFLYAQFYSLLPVFITNGFNKKNLVGGVFLINSFVVISFSYALAKRLSSYPIRCLIISAYLLFAFGALFPVFYQNIFSVYLCVIFWSFSEILLMPSLNALLVEATEFRVRLVGFAINALAIGIGESLGNFYGILIARLGIYKGLWSYAFESLTCVALTVALVYGFFGTVKKRFL